MLLTKYPRIWYHIQVPGGADSPASLWRDVRAVEGTGLENRRRASVRGFESHSLRQFNIDLRKYPRGRRGSPAKGVDCLKNGARVQIPPSAPRKVVLFVLNRAAFLYIYKCFSLESYICCFFDFAIPLTLPQTAKNTPPDGQIRRGCFMPFWRSGCHSNSASGRRCPSSSGRCCAHRHST